MRKRKLPFRVWYYFRQGWALYFAFVLAAINTLTVTYYLAIEKIPSLQLIFPSFSFYIVFAFLFGIPTLVFIGYIHFKRSPAFSSEQDISQESFPYNFKLPPGYWREVLAPAFIELLSLRIKILKNESISEEEKNVLKTIIEKLQILENGGFVGKPKRMSI